jgi:hypothetical protein
MKEGRKERKRESHSKLRRKLGWQPFSPVELREDNGLDKVEAVEVGRKRKVWYIFLR